MIRAAAPLVLLAVLCAAPACSSSGPRAPRRSLEEVAPADHDPPDVARPARPDTRAASEPTAPPDAPPVAAGQPPDWDREVRLPVAADMNPDPKIVEITVDAKVASVPIDGRAPMMLWTYDGRTPGQLVRARRGDTLRVHFQNHLPESTTIHWHGVRVPNAMDGTPDVQAPVLPGKSFDYEFPLPDAGMFWFHPHMQSPKQLGFGMYAPIIVSDPDEPAALGDELVLVLSDLAPGPGDRPAPPDAGGTRGDIDGREGSVVLVNGRVKPVVQARPGVRQRWRVLNAAKSRYFVLSLPDHMLVQIGSDGGLLETAKPVSELMVTPGERVDVLVVPTGAAGAKLAVQNQPYDRGTGETPPVDDLFYLQLTGDQAPPPLPTPLRRPEPLSSSGALSVDINLDLDGLTNRYTVLVNDKPAATNPIHALVGQTQHWTVRNGSTYDHPFHLHGFFFHEIDADGQPVHPLQWKDTLNIGARSKVDVLVKFDARPGMWMYHCHILDHAELGMMGMVHLQ